MTRKIRGTFCERQLHPMKYFDGRSFRWIPRGKYRVWLLIGCPKRKWQPRKMRCSVGTKAYKVLRLTKDDCARGSHRITK
jgi:hypothetical protein